MGNNVCIPRDIFTKFVQKNVDHSRAYLGNNRAILYENI